MARLNNNSKTRCNFIFGHFKCNNKPHLFGIFLDIRKLNNSTFKESD